MTGKIALVTGASSGIGAATAVALSAAGATVAIAARRSDRLRTLADRIGGSGGKVLVINADLGTEEGARACVAKVEESFGQLDILINNAGVMYLAPTERADLGEWRKMIELNVLGLISASQAALGGMKARHQGHIVNISSTAGIMGTPRAGGYAASKHAVHGFSEALRKELVNNNIRVTVISPGMVETELRDHTTDAEAGKLVKDFAASVDQLQPEDIANAVLYAVTQPDRVCINEILLRPTDQER